MRSKYLRVAGSLSRSEWLLLGLVLLCYTYFLAPQNTNAVSRYDMVYALAHGTAIIDPLAHNTIDVSVFAGHSYSPRSIGLSLLGVPFMWLLPPLQGQFSGTAWTFPIAILNLLTVVPVALVAVIVFERFLLRLRPALTGTPLPLIVTGAFALGTLFFPFSTIYFSHAFGGSLAFIAFYLLYRSRTSPRAGRLIVGAGLAMGYAIISEYPTAVIMLVLAAYIWLAFPSQRPRALLLFAAGMIPSALILGWYNWFAFGNPLHMSYEYVAGSAFAGQHTGLFGITLPRPAAYWETLVWPRGLLVESPFLALVPLGLFRWLRERARPSDEALVVLAVTFLYPSLIASYFLPMAGENLPGPRLLVPALPFACLALGWVVDDARRWLRALFGALAAFGVVGSALFVMLGVREYHTYQTYPLTELFWPVLATGSVPRANGATPPNLGALWLHLPQGVSIYLVVLPIAVAIWWSIRAVLRVRGSETVIASLSDTLEVEATPQPVSPGI